MNNAPRPQLFASASPVVTRIIPVLAKAIGLNESIVLMQIAYLISVASDDNYHDGKWWTYQSVRHLQTEYFPYWSVMTVNRALNELTDKRLLIDGNYNKLAYDKTRWFALNDDEIDSLGVVKVVYQNGTGVYQNGTRKSQIDTTIPETTTETTTKKVKDSATTQRKPNPLYDGIAHHLFGLSLEDKTAIKAINGKIVALIPFAKDRVNPDELPQFVAWWKVKYPGMDIPTGSGTFARHWVAYEAQRKPAPIVTAPLDTTALQAEIDAQIVRNLMYANGEEN